MTTKAKFLVAVGLAVLACVALYLITVVVLGLRAQGYDHTIQYISELGADGAPDGPIFNAMLIAIGATLLLNGVGYWVALSGRRWGRITAFVIGMFGVGIVAGGIFSCDPGCAGATLSAKLHGLLGLPTLVSTFVAPFLLAWATVGDDRWPIHYGKITSAIGVLAIPLFLSTIPVPQTFWFIGYFDAHGIIGVGQRVYLVVQLLWVFTLCVGLLHYAFRLPNYSVGVRTVRAAAA